VKEYKRVLIYTDTALMRGWKEAGNIQDVGIQEAGKQEVGIDEARMQHPASRIANEVSFNLI
jgi:hypothetical protein